MHSLTIRNNDILISGILRENIKVKKLKYIIKNNSIQLFSDSQLRASIYLEIYKTISEHYNLESEKETFMLYISLIEEEIFKNKNFILNT